MSKCENCSRLETLHPASSWTEAEGPVLWWAAHDGDIGGPWRQRTEQRQNFWSRIPKVELPGGAK